MDPITAPAENTAINYKDYVAHSNKRFLNALLDGFFFIFFSWAVGYLLGFLRIFTGEENQTFYYLISIILHLSFFIFFETKFSKTPAKFITKTKVIGKDGSKPGFKRVLLRTLVRYFPFEILSFLGKYPVGWHDKWAGTLVIDETKLNKSETQDNPQASVI